MSYAKVSWTVEDIQTIREDLTDEQAEAFLNRNESRIQDRLTELGWEVIETLLLVDDQLPPDPDPDDEDTDDDEGDTDHE